MLITVGVLFHQKEKMQRRTAIFLLLLAFAGTFVPVALAATAPPPHACCLRNAHHCHDSAGSSEQPSFHASADCCNHDCCRAVTTVQSAVPSPLASTAFAATTNGFAAETPATSPALRFSSSRSSRAPPALSIA